MPTSARRLATIVMLVYAVAIALALFGVWKFAEAEAAPFDFLILGFPWSLLLVALKTNSWAFYLAALLLNCATVYLATLALAKLSFARK